MGELLSRAEAIQNMGSVVGGFPASDPAVGTLVRSCEELANGGSPAAALKLTEMVESTSETFSPDWRVRLMIAKAQAQRALGNFEAALSTCKDIRADSPHVLQRMPEHDVVLNITECAALWQLNACDEAVERLSALRRTLLEVPDSPSLARCTLELSSAYLFQGCLSAAWAYSLDSLVSARRCGNQPIEGYALGNLARVEKYLCRWASAEELSRSALEMFESLGYSSAAHISRRSLAIVLWKRGRLAEAMELTDECHLEASVKALEAHRIYAVLLKANILLHQGSYDKAIAILEAEGGAITPQNRGSLLREELLGEVFLEVGRFKEALRQFETVEPWAVAMIPNGDIAAELPRRKAEALLGLGDVAAAQGKALASVEICRKRRDRYEEAATYRTLALSAAALGRSDEAKQWFMQGLACYEEIETPYEWGRLWMAYGDWLRGPHARECGDALGALEAYRAARDHFERMGAMGKLSEVDGRIAGLVPQGISLVTEPGSGAMHRPLRRPRGAGELDRRSAWAREVFGIVTRNKPLIDRLEESAKLARSQLPILILGESGTGKELVAKGVHRLSCRTGTFMPINCGALPRDVIESDLFGHVTGSFTGATRDKAGLFEVCHGGTAFLDEIGEMSLELQAKLLRFLETGEFRRVGSTKNISVDTLVVAATNRERAALYGGDGFRQDLYWRLAHAVITLPPLRRRGEDIDLLISHFLDELCEQHSKHVTLSAPARDRLVRYSWPGNVRQLHSTLRRLVILGTPGGEVGPEAIELVDAEVPANLMEELGQAERRRIVEALSEANASRTDAARALGMSRTTLLGKMKRYGIR